MEKFLKLKIDKKSKNTKTMKIKRENSKIPGENVKIQLEFLCKKSILERSFARQFWSIFKHCVTCVYTKYNFCTRKHRFLGIVDNSEKQNFHLYKNKNGKLNMRRCKKKAVEVFRKHFYFLLLPLPPFSVFGVKAFLMDFLL